MVDVLRSGTRCPGAPYRPVNGGDIHGEPAVELVFCNPDLLWRGSFERPRLGQGAFVEAFQAVYKARSIGSSAIGIVLTRYDLCVQSVTGHVYPYTQYGKPYEETYRFAETILIERIAELESRHSQEIHLPHM